MQSKFYSDLDNEQELALFLDKNYYNNSDKFSDNFIIDRIKDADLQQKGVDLIITNKNTDKKYYIDEKAQLHYINKNLPTFAFELSYIKDNITREGWLFDKHKITQKYFIITCIKKSNNQFQSCRLISIDRNKLLFLLKEKSITRKNLTKYENQYRNNNDYSKHFIKELGKKEGFLFYSKHLAEKPINIVFYLDYLIKQKVGKELFQCK